MWIGQFIFGARWILCWKWVQLDIVLLRVAAWFDNVNHSAYCWRWNGFELVCGIGHSHCHHWILSFWWLHGPVLFAKCRVVSLQFTSCLRRVGSNEEDVCNLCCGCFYCNCQAWIGIPSQYDAVCDARVYDAVWLQLCVWFGSCAQLVKCTRPIVKWCVYCARWAPLFFAWTSVSSLFELED